MKPKRCNVCERLLRIQNKSELCSYHNHIKYQKKKRKLTTLKRQRTFK